ncbi:unnamed protein product [Protopolystoma xenopodis]|uniref:Uncharacterized protein n=1 Tax=Protopolystoma xenopodis TaxID=117903 RepID=A0A3S5AHS9_9PLAT|nr:unnamed protein product [Protopolystoma xenopodis]
MIMLSGAGLYEIPSFYDLCCEFLHQYFTPFMLLFLINSEAARLVDALRRRRVTIASWLDRLDSISVSGSGSPAERHRLVAVARRLVAWRESRQPDVVTEPAAGRCPGPSLDPGLGPGVFAVRLSLDPAVLVYAVEVARASMCSHATSDSRSSHEAPSSVSASDGDWLAATDESGRLGNLDRLRGLARRSSAGGSVFSALAGSWLCRLARLEEADEKSSCKVDLEQTFVPFPPPPPTFACAAPIGHTFGFFQLSHDMRLPAGVFLFVSHTLLELVSSTLLFNCQLDHSEIYSAVSTFTIGQKTSWFWCRGHLEEGARHHVCIRSWLPCVGQSSAISPAS